jgi:SAM-dependent methyltransferase
LPPVPRARKSLVAALAATLVLVVGILGFENHVSQSTPVPGEGGGSKPVEVCPKVRPSRLATSYLEKLHGVEIGASTQNSFYLSRSMNVDFADEIAEYWQHKACPRAVVNIVALGDDLPFKDGTLDYVLSSHVIEHFYDPVKALKEWHRVIKPGGYIFVIAPHKDRTFDTVRDVTPLKELVERFNRRIRISDYARPLNQKALEKYNKEKLGPFYQVMPQLLVRSKANTPLEDGWAYYESDDHHHWSVWRTSDFVALVEHLKFKVVEVRDVDDKIGNGFTVVIRK